MIELLSITRCTNCNICVRVCPTNVFDEGDEAPSIARQEDCQTCFQCEASCPADAMFVAPLRWPERRANSPYHNEDWLAHTQQLGRYRRACGLEKGSVPRDLTDEEYVEMRRVQRSPWSPGE